MLRPNFEDPLNTAQDLVDNNITLFDQPGNGIWKQWLGQSPIPAYRKLAETWIGTEDWDEYEYVAEHHAIGKGTHAQMVSFLYPEDLEMGRWWRSTEKISGLNPYVGYITNKKWYLNEVSILILIKV